MTSDIHAKTRFLTNNDGSTQAIIVRFMELSIKPLFLVLIASRAAVDGLARNFSLSANPSQSVNFLGMLNILITLLGVGYFFLIRKRLPRYPFVLTLIAFLIAILVSMLLAVDPFLSLRGLMTIGSYFSIYILTVFAFPSKKDVISIRKAIIYSSIVPILFGVYQVITITGNTEISPGINRIMGTFFHPSAYGMYLLFIWPVILSEIYNSKKNLSKLWYFLLLLGVSFSILMTYTRITWLGLGLYFIGAVFILRLYKKPVLMLFIFAVFAILFLNYYPVLTERFEVAFQFSNGRIIFSEYGSVAWRFQQWKTALDVFSINPIFGIGWWNFPLFNKWQSTPHNEYLRVLSETGLFGFVFFMLLFSRMGIWFFQAYRKSPRKSSISIIVGMAFISVFVLALLCITDNPFGQPEVSWYFWVSIAAAINAFRLSNQKIVGDIYD